MPEGLFAFKQKIPITVNYAMSCNGKVGIFYVYLVYFTAIGNILWPFGIFCGHLVYFSPFWYIVKRKIWQPCPGGL
jgi:hypothetical protein